MKKLKYLSFVVVLAITVSCSEGLILKESFAENDNLVEETTTIAPTRLKAAKESSGNFIKYDSANVLIQTYQDSIKTNHFTYNSQKIAGYKFTRQELVDLMALGDTNELFLMWGLSSYVNVNNDSSKYLNLIIGALKKSPNGNKMKKNLDFLIPNSEIPSFETYTKPNLVIKENFHPIDIDSLIKFAGVFQSIGDIDHIISKVDGKTDSIRGYKISNKDLVRAQVYLGCPNDIFVFIPVITPRKRILDTRNPFFHVDHLSIAFGRIDNFGNYLGQYSDYCDPCPSQCMNYKQLFID